MLGLNYLAGPFEWLADSDTTAIIALLGGLDAHYRGERYRVSHWLRQRVWLNPRPGVQPS
jgi:3-hydroxybutyryl-CoA dehydrogenase